MNRVLGWACIIGGLLWGAKPIYDVIINGRRWSEGYEPSSPVDYISFLFPILCIGGLIVVYSLFKKDVRNSIVILIAAVILNGLFSFSEVYFYGSNLPFGLIFTFTGLLCMIIGSILLFLKLKKKGSSSKMLSWITLVIFLDTILLVASGALSEVLPEELMNPISMFAFISMGFIWALFGWAALKLSTVHTNLAENPTNLKV